MVWNYCVWGGLQQITCFLFHVKMLSTSTETCFTTTGFAYAQAAGTSLGMGALKWDHSVSRLSVFQHHFWTGVPAREREEREEAGEHPASGKQTGRETGAPATPCHSPITSQQAFGISEQQSNWLVLVTKKKKKRSKTTNLTFDSNQWDLKSHSGQKNTPQLAGFRAK